MKSVSMRLRLGVVALAGLTILGAWARSAAAQVSFTSSIVPVLSGQRLAALATADLNGDGKLDLVVVRPGQSNLPGTQDTVVVLLGDGLGGFAVAQTQTLPTVHAGSVSFVAVGDLNRDGKPDVVIGQSMFFPGDPGEGVLVLLNQGGGLLGPASYYPLPPSMNGTGTLFHIAVGDLNRDGKPDVAVARFSEGVEGIYVLPGNGDGTLGAAVWALHTDDNDSVAIADFDGDGKPDLATVDEKGYFFLAKGDGALGFVGLSLGQVSGASEVVAADLNGGGRGRLDLVSASAVGVQVFLGQGGAAFSAPTTLPPLFPGTAPFGVAVAVADMNGDGKPDIVAMYQGVSPCVAVYLGNGDGAFGSALLVADLTGVGNPKNLVLGDFDRDGRPDIAVVLGGSFPAYLDVAVVVLRNTTAFAPAGTFTAATSHPTGDRPLGVAVGTTWRDGTLDVVTANGGSDDLTLLNGTGAGGVGLIQTFPVGAGTAPVAVALADFNRDGLLDALVANQSGDSVSLKLGAGQGVFPFFLASSTVAMGDGPAGLAVGDLNRDGILDVVVTNANANTVTVRRGNGGTGFLGPVTYATGARPIGVALGDLNGDGKLDLVVANRDADSLTVRLGTGISANPFGPATTVAVGDGPVAVALGDLNRDGQLDAVVANFLAGTVSVLLGDGNGGFAAPITVAVGTTPLAIALADLNRDGILDLVVVRSSANQIRVLFGNGAGGFPTKAAYAVGSLPSAIAVADLDRDGRLDLVVTNWGDDTVPVLLNGP